MKILIVAHGFPPSGTGGAEIYAEAHARTLRRRFSDSVTILARENDRARPEYQVRDEWREDGLRIVWVNNTFRNSASFQDTYRNQTIGQLACRLMDEMRPDVAHVHHLTCLSTTIVESLAARSIPCILTLHDYWMMCHRGQLLDTNYRLCAGPRECSACIGPAAPAGRAAFLAGRALRTLERMTAGEWTGIRRAAVAIGRALPATRHDDRESQARLQHMQDVCGMVARFLAPSRHLRDRFVAFGIPAERITLAPYGFDHEPFACLERTRSTQLRVGFLGSLMISKAPHVLLEAVERLPPGAVSVDLFGAVTAYHGDDGYRQVLEPLLARVPARVHGSLPHESVAHALGTLDVLVVPSIWPENSPLVIREAFLAGVPVLASRIGGIPEIVEHGRGGLLFRPGDSDDLAQRLTQLLEMPGLLDQLRATIPEVRTIEADVEETRALYLECVSRRPTAAGARSA